MGIKSMELSWIVVKDLAKSKKFFAETLGLDIKNIDEEMGWLELTSKGGGCRMGVSLEHPGSIAPGHNAVITFTVDNIEKTKKELEAKGVSFKGDVEEVPDQIWLLQAPFFKYGVKQPSCLF